jgi:hypothetical protein
MHYVNFESTEKSCFILIVLADHNVSFSRRSLLHEIGRCLQTVGVNGDNIKVAHKWVLCTCVEKIGQTQKREQWHVFMATMMRHRFLWKAWNFLTSWATVSSSDATWLHAVHLIRSIYSHIYVGDRVSICASMFIRIQTSKYSGYV